MCEHHGDSYTERDALAVMRTTGPAHLDHEGVLVESGEWVAAIYESYAADQEWNRGDTYLTRPQCMPYATWSAIAGNDYTIADYGDSLASLSSYTRAAEELSEEIFRRDIESVSAAVDWPDCP